ELLPCSFSSADSEFTCNLVRARVTEGPEEGAIVELELPLGAGIVEINDGDDIVLSYEPGAPPEAQYQFADFQRETPLALLALVFVVAVVALGRLRGGLAIAGLVASLLVIGVFVLPALLRGSSPLAVALVGASVVAFIALYLAHGVTARTTVALLGSLASLVLTGMLALVFVAATKLTGLADESAGFLQLTAGQVDLEGLLLAGIVIGSLGVLDDVTVTQVSAVWELHRTDPGLGPAGLYRSAVRIGRDHIASTVNTLVLAYAGASLPLLLLFTEADRAIGDVVTGETVAVEIVRTLVGSIGLVASVPITTALAAVVVGGEAPPRLRRTPRARPRPPRSQPPRSERPRSERSEPPSWDDFAPPDL
ncbi:MAG: YibE/F family protein, partial [Chloroflexi bacterium]|nr:YibE/F family protein [Chloroflexota bacterium]